MVQGLILVTVSVRPQLTVETTVPEMLLRLGHVTPILHVQVSKDYVIIGLTCFSTIIRPCFNVIVCCFINAEVDIVNARTIVNMECLV